MDPKYGPGPDYAPDYVPDSAPTAVAWSTGKKTGDARLSQGMSTDLSVPGSNEGFTTTFEIMKARGKAVGNVTTSELSDATPAAPSSHISRRGCQGPADARNLCPTETKAAGGLGSIVEQQVDHRLDVNLGGGRAQYEETLDNSTTTVVDYALSKGFQYVTDAAGLSAVQSVKGKPVLGLFAPVNMTTQFAPLIAAPTPGAGSPTTRCNEDNRPESQPSLAAMTEKAIELLDDDRHGFFLQVESASIDKRDHASDLCGQIGETLQLDQALKVALAFQRGIRTRWSSRPPTTRTPARSWPTRSTRPASTRRSRPRTARRCASPTARARRRRARVTPALASRSRRSGRRRRT